MNLLVRNCPPVHSGRYRQSGPKSAASYDWRENGDNSKEHDDPTDLLRATHTPSLLEGKFARIRAVAMNHFGSKSERRGDYHRSGTSCREIQRAA